MFIELPQTLASSADLFHDPGDGVDAPQTITVERGHAPSSSRARMSAARAVPQVTLRISLQPGEGFEGTFTQG